MLETARTQIAGTVSQTEVANASAQRAQLPGSRAAGSRRLSHQHRQQSALRRNLRRAGPGHLGGQPAQFLQQLHRGRPFRQRRCGRAERHLLRPRRGAANFRWSRRAGRRSWAARWAATSTWSPRAAPIRCTAICTATSATSASTRPIRFPTPNCRSTQAQYGASLGGPVVQRPHLLLRELRAARAEPERPDHHRAGQCRAINARLAAVGYQGAQIVTGSIRTRCTTPISWPRWITSSAQRSVQRPLQPVRCAQQQLARRRRAERGQRFRRPGQHRSDDRGQQRRDALAAHGQRNARAVHAQQPERAAHRSDRPGGQHFGRRDVRHALRALPPGAQQSVRNRRQSLAPGWGARAAGRRRISCTTTPPSPIRDRFAAATRSPRWPIS